MAKYAIGDIQGCYTKFTELLSKINFNPSKDTLYLVGDLVNRGPQSLQVLQWVYDNQDSINLVLGNHDIFLLGRYSKVVALNPEETIGEILNSPNATKLIDYLRNCPLIFEDDKHIMVHAGIYPKINFHTLSNLNNNISTCLKSKHYARFIEKIYGNKPNVWNENLSLIKQMRFVVNTTTRMRFLDTTTFALDYKYKGEVDNHPQNLIPWFKIPKDSSVNKKIIFGHWAALGFYQDDNFVALDTGCVWGRKLTAFNLDTSEVIQVIA